MIMKICIVAVLLLMGYAIVLIIKPKSAEPAKAVEPANPLKQDNEICKERGHVFDLQEERRENIIVNVFSRPEHDEVVDTKDSSYIVKVPPSDFKYCYRCNKMIEFPKKPEFVRTIWVKK